MKKIIFTLIFLTSIHLKSQVTKDFKTNDSIESCLLGFWTKADSSKSGTKYLIEKTDKELYLSTGEFKKGGLEFLIKDKIRLEIIRKRKKLFIQNIELENKNVSELIFLSSNKMTLKSGKKRTDYSKVE